MNPLSTRRNKYHTNIKNSTVFTPPGVALYIYEKVVRPLKKYWKRKVLRVLDPAIGAGNLVELYEDAYIVGFDIDNYNYDNCDCFFQQNFLDETEPYPDIDIIVCNPPFNTDKRNKDWLKEHKMGKALLPEVFADKVFELYPGTPYVMITPMGFIFNQRKHSSRWRKYSTDKINKISSIMMLPLNAFPGVEFHCCIICFNFPPGLLKPFYWFEEKYL